jgi:acetyltransferase-like isoleucine patch superfamily enzyme
MKMKSEGESVHKALMDTKKSSFKKYKELFVGEESFFFLVTYEWIVMFFSWIPGALGLFLRKLFYPLVFKKVGKGVVFGRNITIRHPRKISIGDNSSVDENVVLDAKGFDNEGIFIGEHVIIGRNTILSCKGGSIHLGDYSNISANCSLLSESKINLGKYCFLAGHCYLVAGGNHSFLRTDIPIMFQPSVDKGGISVGEDVWIGASATVLDGVSIGKGSIIGAGAVVRESLPEYAIAAGIPAKKIRDRKKSE